MKNSRNILFFIIISNLLCIVSCDHKVKVPQVNKGNVTEEEVITEAVDTDTVKEIEYIAYKDIEFITYGATNYFSYKSEEGAVNPEEDIILDISDSTAVEDENNEFLTRTFFMQWPKKIKHHTVANLQRAIMKTAFGDSCTCFDDIINNVNECIEPNAKKLKSLPDLVIENGVNAEETKINFENLFNNIITYKIYKYEYVAMAAHPLESEFYVNFDVANDKQINIIEIIRPESMADLRNLIIDKIMRDHESIEFSETQSINNFIINDGIIKFVFNHYEIACYAEGIIKAEVTFDEIEPMLNEYGKSILIPEKQKATILQ